MPYQLSLGEVLETTDLGNILIEVSQQILRRIPDGLKLAYNPKVSRVVQIYPSDHWPITDCDWLFPNNSYSHHQEAFILIVDKRAYTPESDVILVLDLDLIQDGVSGSFDSGILLSAIFWRNELWGYAAGFDSDFFHGCCWGSEVKADIKIIDTALKSYPDAMWCHIARRLPEYHNE